MSKMASWIGDKDVARMAALWTSEKYSDLKIFCQGQTFHVHKAIVCTQSKVLAAAVDGHFKEATTGEIILDEEEGKILEKFLLYFYIKDFEDGAKLVENTMSGNPSESGGLDQGYPHWAKSIFTSRFASGPDPPDSALLVSVKMYIMGDKYDVQDLKELAVQKYAAATLVPHPESSKFFACSLALLYDETTENDRMLKDVAVREAGRRVEELVEDPDFASICGPRAEIIFDILKASVTSSVAASSPPFVILAQSAPQTLQAPFCPWHRSVYCIEPGKKTAISFAKCKVLGRIFEFNSIPRQG